MERQSYWYSVVQFQPDKIRGERINVGVVMHNPSNGQFGFRLIDDDNIKVRSFTSDSTRLRAYRANKDFLEHILLHTSDHQLNFVGDIQVPSPNDEKYLLIVNKFLPNEISLSEPTFVMTSNYHAIFERLMKQYIGEQFLRADTKPHSTKQFVKHLFEERQWIGTKVRHNVRIRPAKAVPMAKAQIDFVFKNGLWNLIQTVPDNDERLSDWFIKFQGILRLFEEEADFHIMWNPLEAHDETSVRQMIRYLISKDPRVSEVKLGDKSFMKLEERISQEAKDISDIGDELIWTA